MLTSLFFVVLGLIQFSFVLHLHQCNSIREQEKKRIREEDVNGENLIQKEHGHLPLPLLEALQMKTMGQSTRYGT